VREDRTMTNLFSGICNNFCK